jgi:AI-2 transport protein TqsA
MNDANSGNSTASVGTSAGAARVAVVAVAIVVVAGAMKIAAVVFVPLVVALLFCLLLWPARRRLARHLPDWITATLCSLVAVLALLAVAGFTSYAASSAWEQFQGSKGQYVEHYQELRSWAMEHGLPGSMLPKLRAEPADATTSTDDAEATGDERDAATSRSEQQPPKGDQQAQFEAKLRLRDKSGDRLGAQEGELIFGQPEDEPEHYLLSPQTRERLAMVLAGGLRSAAGMMAAAVLTIFLLFLALLEGERWSDFASRKFSSDKYSHLRRVVEMWGAQTRQYLLAKTITGLVSGGVTGLWLWAMGVPIPLVWAVLTFLMNYIPNVGALISGLPPALLAVITLGWWQAIIVAVGLVVIETSVGNLLDPLLQGDMLKLSPFLMLASLIFWGWLWGLMGAVLAPLLSAAIVSATKEIRRAVEHHHAAQPRAG